LSLNFSAKSAGEKYNNANQEDEPQPAAANDGTAKIKTAAAEQKEQNKDK
jgi:hypothetical protein